MACCVMTKPAVHQESLGSWDVIYALNISPDWFVNFMVDMQYKKPYLISLKKRDAEVFTFAACFCPTQYLTPKIHKIHP